LLLADGPPMGLGDYRMSGHAEARQ